MATVYVKNIALATDDKEIKDFFSFWYVNHSCPAPDPTFAAAD